MFSKTSLLKKSSLKRYVNTLLNVMRIKICMRDKLKVEENVGWSVFISQRERRSSRISFGGEKKRDIM